ncbi:MAG TPA: hypothetical protein VK845_07985, partial [Gemmatimonadales bacterium]|nr:hypothetical protein [Gemmatimonadales bacterium]
NYPYRGNTDGLTRHLRSRFPPSAYLGIELEVNQKHMTRRGARGREVRRAVVAALCGVLDDGWADGRMGGWTDRRGQGAGMGQTANG